MEIDYIADNALFVESVGFRNLTFTLEHMKTLHFACKVTNGENTHVIYKDGVKNHSFCWYFPEIERMGFIMATNKSEEKKIIRCLTKLYESQNMKCILWDHKDVDKVLFKLKR